MPKGLSTVLPYIVLGIFIGLLMCFFFVREHGAVVISHSCASQYPLTSRLLDCGEYDNSKARIASIDAQFDASIAKDVADGKATRVSVWLRDLNTNQSAATNETDTYAPASLFKVPILIAYYKLAEIQPSILDLQMAYPTSTAQYDQRQDYKSGSTLVPGQSYSVERLLEEMITRSDNAATSILASQLDQNTLNGVYVDLGVKIPKSASDSADFLTAKSYANIFRSLYNASYLDREYSEKALELLSKSTFSGMADSFPKNTVVAQKFGERKDIDANGNVVKVELHDCGIVYKRDRPFSLCIMTEGTDFNTLLSIIHDLSHIAYDGV